MIEADRVECLAGEPERRRHAIEQRQGPEDRALPELPHRACGATMPARATSVRFVRVGTLDDPDRLPPDIHIFTSSKQPWVVLPARHAGRSGVLRRERALAGREPGAASCVARVSRVGAAVRQFLPFG